MNVSNDILSFEEWHTDRFYVGPGDRLINSSNTSPINRDLSADTLNRILAETCPYCSAKLTRVSQRRRDSVDNGNGSDWRYGWATFALSLCPQCGYWHEHEVRSFHDVMPRGSEEAKLSVLRRFNTDDLDVPLRSVESHLIEHPDLLGKIHPVKVEELVGHMLREQLACETAFTKRSRDGGFDIICVESAAGRRLVQVKRYKDKITVSAIREFAGVLVREGVTKGFFVTTGEYTTDAIKEINAFAKASPIPILIDPISGREILSFIDALRNRKVFNVLDIKHVGSTLKWMKRLDENGIGDTIGDFEKAVKQYAT